METSEYQQYIATLVRLIETRQSHEGNEAAQQEVDVAMRRMKGTIVAAYGESGWATIERDAEQTLRQLQTQSRSGIILL